MKQKQTRSPQTFFGFLENLVLRFFLLRFLNLLLTKRSPSSTMPPPRTMQQKAFLFLLVLVLLATVGRVRRRLNSIHPQLESDWFQTPYLLNIDPGFHKMITA
jgi:hypothetical protein